MGHGGTVDRFAEGVLVIGVGEDCKKLAKYLTGTTKNYEVTCELGKLTDTLDNAGVVLEEAPWGHVTRESVELALGRFRGDILQTPPIFSALKFKGKRFSDRALEARRKNTPISDATTPTPSPRVVTVHSIRLLDFDPPRFTVGVACSSGTYMRSLVRDVAVQLGSVGHAVALVRRRQGRFAEQLALRRERWRLEDIARAIEQVDEEDNMGEVIV